MPPKKIQSCLLVEDLADDALLVKKELRSEPDLTVDWVQDGEQAIEYLEGRPPFAERRIPDVILLDLKLPRMDGFAFMEWQRSRAPEPQRVIPVVILSISNLPEDIRRAQDLGAKAYLTKQTTWTRVARQLSSLDLFAPSPAPATPGPQRLTIALTLPSGKKVRASASADSPDQEVRFVYSGDTSLLHPFAEKGTIDFFRWYMKGCAFNLGAQLDIIEH